MFKYLIILLSCSTFAFTFNEAVEELKNHNSLQAMKGSAKSLLEKSQKQASWGDPMFKIAAKNLPVDSLKFDQTPMSGLEFGIGQKIALSNKYGKAGESQSAQARSINYSAMDLEQALTKSLWANLIEYKRINNELDILKENLSWISKMLKVSKKLYSNGRITQQALLDIQIRKSEVESEISNKNFEIKQNKSQLKYLVGNKALNFNYKSVPWKLLDTSKTEGQDFRLSSLKENLKAKEYSLEQSKLAYIPDITVSVGYTIRSDIDNNGDFIGAQITFPIPVSDDKSGAKGEAVANRYVAFKQLDDYKLKKSRDIEVIKDDIAKLNAELRIISRKSVNFAQNSRSITSKSYGLGNSTYVELLQSEIRLQTILLKKVALESKLSMRKVDLKYTLGESLYE
ncbi:TolC family protein [Halobacteriovorax vibrionivorans]|uniref:TolC family protein n=1 Tax=Halobacteriovorax vibrionivorans TaxID=2152716 RepID=A0ABY0IFZ8_9BACT|nr:MULTISPECIES: TolC family protein [Halobacteriovorax]RZF21510.1 TolC family protein [Halobacteriovorax vibrionivorans]TGD48782.1 TolC family protein [Halobacteriovorax sp. Y22]